MEEITVAVLLESPPFPETGLVCRLLLETFEMSQDTSLLQVPRE